MRVCVRALAAALLSGCVMPVGAQEPASAAPPSIAGQQDGVSSHAGQSAGSGSGPGQELGPAPRGGNYHRMDRGGPDRVGPDRGEPGPPPGGVGMRGALQLGPPGRWWDDPEIVSDMHLKPEQQSRMDAIFARNKPALMARFDSLRQQERELAELSRGANIDEHALFAHIDRVSQARAELEKANAHMLLELRAELSPAQLATLDAHRGPPR